MRKLLATGLLISFAVLGTSAQAAIKCNTAKLKGTWDMYTMVSSTVQSGWVKSKLVFKRTGALAPTSTYELADGSKGRLSGKMRISTSCAMSGTIKVMGMTFTLDGARLDKGQGRVAAGVGSFPGDGQFQFNMIKR